MGRNRREKDPPHASIDDLDARILAVLMADGRSSNIDIARAVGSSEATVRRRVEAMTRQGVFQVIALADAYKIGFQVQVFIGISAEPRRLKAVARRVAALPPIRFLVYTTGPYSLFAQAFFATIADLNHFLVEELNSISGVLKTETTVVLSFIKRTWDYQLSSPKLRKAHLEGLRRLESTG